MLLATQVAAPAIGVFHCSGVLSRRVKDDDIMKAILVAEDDASARELVKDALSEVPEWVVTAVEDGAKLLEMLGTVNPSLIVLDVNMPGLSGLEVYRLLRQAEGGSSVPVL